MSQGKYSNEILKIFFMEEGGCYFKGSSGSYYLQGACGFTRVLGENMTEYVLCS